MTKYILNNYRKSRIVVISLWLIYASSYFVRACYAATIASIVSEGVYDKGEIGLVGTAFFVCYGVGQLISGLIGDRINPFAMIISGSAAGAVCCFCIPAANNIVLMTVIWAANGFFQSMLWSPILRVFSETIDEKLRKRAILDISLSLPVGTICAYLISTLIIKYLKWQYVFICGGICIFLAALFVLLILIYSKKDLTQVKVNAVEKRENTNHSMPKQNLMHIAVLSGLFIIMIPSFLHGMMRDGITNWVPTMITETYGVSPSFSVFLTIVLPIFNAFGAYAVVPIYKKLGENEMKTAGVVGLFALIPLLFMLGIGKLPVYITVLLLALTTSMMYALNYLIISLVPVRFSKQGCTSSVSGILNSSAHIGCAVSSYGFGAVSEKSGWNAVVVVWIVSALFTAVFSFLSNIKWAKFNTSVQSENKT